MTTFSIGQLVGGRYRLDAALARGGMGAVYRATDTRLSRTVAIKVLLSELAGDTVEIARFEREASAIARITHPGIIQVLDVGHEGDTAYLVMEHVQGRTLADVLGKDGKLEPMRAADITEQALFAIGAAHAAGIVHRDLKPGNVMLVPTGGREMVKVLDFGIAQLKTGTAYTRLTATGAILGTPAFMAPEQARGEECDARTDVYAMGVLLWCMLTGKKPFVGRDVVDTIGKVLTEVPTRADRVEPSVPAALASICDVALQKAPSARFASAQAFANALVDLRRAAPASQVPLPGERAHIATMITPEGTSVPRELVGAPRVSFVPSAPLAPPMPTAVMTPVSAPNPTAFTAPPIAPQRTWNARRIVLGVLAIVALTMVVTCAVGALVLRRYADAVLPTIGAPVLPSIGAPVLPSNGAPIEMGGGSTCARAERCCDVLTHSDQSCAQIRIYELEGETGERACQQLYDGYLMSARAQGLPCD